MLITHCEVFGNTLGKQGLRLVSVFGVSSDVWGIQHLGVALERYDAALMQGNLCEETITILNS